MSSQDAPFAESDGPPRHGRLLAERYRLEHHIDSGGMAEVWEALDQVLGRRVAIKILHSHLASDESFVRRFRAEAIAAARLSHPSIVSVYDTCSTSDLEAIVMELVSGTTMRAELDAHGPMQLTKAIAIGSQIADALGAAHAAGLVHRDVKPANILLSSDGRVLVADFGIAKAAEGSDLTAAGAMVGTAKYLAPEQVRDDAVDGRADLYALGVVLYEALAGRPPFVAETDAGTALARLHRDPRPLLELRPDLPAAVGEVIALAMRREPAERFADAAALRAALLDAEAGVAPAIDVAPGPEAGPVPLSSRPAPPPPSPPAPPVAPPVAPSRPSDPPALAERPEHRPRPPVTSEPSPHLPPPPALATGRPDRRRLLIAGFIVLIVLIAGLTAWRLGSSPGRDRGPRPLADASILDPPPGDGREHDDEAVLAIDGDPASAWTSERYRDPASIGGKDGVGLAVTLDGTASIDRVEVATREGGWSMQVYAATGDLPGSRSGWGAPLASVADATEARNALRFDAVDADHVLLWFTALPPSGAVAVTEVTVLGR